MDTQYQYLESMGDMFQNAARVQKQIGEFSRLMGFGMWSPQDLSDMMSRSFGFDALAQYSTEFMKLYRNILEGFQQSMKGFLSLMELVPKRDYLALLQEYENLRKRSKELHGPSLENVLHEGLSLQSESLKSFEDLMRKQVSEFQNLMASFIQLMTETQAPLPSAAAQGPETKKAPQARRRSPASASRGAAAGKEPKK